MKDFLTSLSCFALGGFVIWEASGYPRQRGVEMHPGHYPGILGYLLVLLGAAVLIKFLVFGGEKPKPSEADQIRVAALLAALAAYAFAIEELGYGLSTFLFVALAVWLFRGTLRASLVTGLAGAVALELVFRFLFRTPLPAGVLAGVL